MQPLRFLRRSPALSAAAIASLALGIGANVTVYSVVREMVFDDLSATQPSRLVRLDATASYAQYRDLHAAHVFQDLAFQLNFGDVSWHTASGREVAWRLGTSANFFDVLGVNPLFGRLYTQADEGRDVAVVSYGFWRKRLEADSRAIGRTLALNGRLYTLLGVLPSDYRSVMGHSVSPEIYLPAGAESARCRPFGRLRPDLTRDQTRVALEAAANRIGGADFARHISILRPMSGLAANSAAEGDQHLFFLFFLMLLAVAGMLALIACSNVAGLMLARGLSRQRELAIRKALGAGRLQLAWPLLAEGAVLVVSGAGAGLALDAFLRDLLRHLRWPSAYNIPVEFHFQTDRGLLLYAFLVSAAALLITSVMPAIRGAGADVGIALKQGEPQYFRGRWNARSSFVLLQVVLCMVLLSLGTLFTRSFVELIRSGPGFDSSHTIIAAVHGATRRDSLVRRIETVPGVLGVTSVSALPFMGELPVESVRREGEAPESNREAYAIGAGENYFATLSIRVLRGRDFEPADRLRSPVPAILSRSLSERLFGGQEPVGARLQVGNAPDRIVEVVGVAADTRLRTLGEDHVSAIYTPYFEAQFLVRVAGNPTRQIVPLRAALAEIDPNATLDLHPLSDAVEGGLFPMRMAAALVGSLSVVGMLLALVGLYGSISYSVHRRTREMKFVLPWEPPLSASSGRLCGMGSRYLPRVWESEWRSRWPRFVRWPACYQTGSIRGIFVGLRRRACYWLSPESSQRGCLRAAPPASTRYWL